MYSGIKQLILKFIPKAVLFKYEYFLRYMYYLIYIGNRFQCNVCNKKLRSFVKIGNDRLCPGCGSIQRTRRLWQIINDDFLKNKQEILDFSPSRSIYRALKKGDYFYISSDLSGDFISDRSYDIRNINSEDSNYDLIICYHILEHIDDDLKAMKELWRVLKKDRYCIIQTPFKDGEIYEDNSITALEEREKLFGQSDHVRIYSVMGLKERLENVGFNVEVRNFQENYENFHGFNERETVLICYKQE